MYSEVSICNMAIARIGSTKFISALNEQSVQAEVCTLFYSTCRDVILEAYPWKFARKTAALALMGGGVSVPGWEYVYVYPNDCLKALRLVTEAGVGSPATAVDEQGIVVVNPAYRIAYDIVAVGNDRAIVANEENIYLEYTRSVTSANLFTPQFASALAWLIASEIAVPLMADTKAGQVAYQNYLAVAGDAFATSLNEGYEGKIPDSEFVTVRG